VSPDERDVQQLVAAATRRARGLAALEAVALAGAATLNSWYAALIVAAGYIWWTWRRGARSTVIAAIEETHPDSRNVLVTAVEIRDGSLDAKPLVRERVMREAAAQARRVDLARALPLSRVAPIVGLAFVVWLAGGGLRLLRGGRAVDESRRPVAASPSAPAQTLHLNATVRPPAYTHLEPEPLRDPAQITAIEGSTLSIDLDSPAGAVTFEHDGAKAALARGATGHFTAEAVLTRTGYVGLSADNGERRIIPIIVTPDALPTVRINAPARDLIYAGGNPQITFDVRATDDFGLQSLTLDYTKVSGSGEQFDFKEGQLPLAIVRNDARDWQGRVSRSLAELHLTEGDTLVYRASAADERPGAGRASSDAFFIEVSKLGVTAGDAFTLPEQETRYALSQEMLIIKTERLNQRRASMASNDVLEESLNLAVEQRMIRAEFVFMLGGEVEDEEVEAEQSVELQAGRLQNRGQQDLRAATTAMSRSEKLLTGASIPEAIAAERAAVVALQRAFARDRYILRALATRSELDLGRRLTGAVAPLQWTREPAETASNRRAALLQNVLKGLGDAIRASAGGTDQRASVRLLAEEVLRTDPSSSVLRQASVDLEALADQWSSLAANPRLQTLRAIAGNVAPEARRSLADAPPRSSDVAARLRATFDDGGKAGR
jgi:Domain of unknown function (DUF4175)